MWRWFEDDRGGMQALLYRRSVGFGVPSSGTENAGALSSFQRHRILTQRERIFEGVLGKDPTPFFAVTLAVVTDVWCDRWEQDDPVARHFKEMIK
ncbi:hypothetical protein V1478_013560, partial [Vespula squamosa]